MNHLFRDVIVQNFFSVRYIDIFVFSFDYFDYDALIYPQIRCLCHS